MIFDSKSRKLGFSPLHTSIKFVICQKNSSLKTRTKTIEQAWELDKAIFVY